MTTRARAVIVAALATGALAACSAVGSGTTRATSPTRATTPTTVHTGIAPSLPLDPHRAARPSPGCARHTAIHTGISDHLLRIAGVNRVYQIDVPAGYDGSVPYALVFGLHALTVDYRFVPSMTGFELGARRHFIGVNPSGLLAGATPYWDAAPTAANYDVEFLTRLLDHLEAGLCIDTARVFSTGMSNGAQMSSLLACRLGDRLAAIAPVSGEEFLEPCTGPPVAIMAFHGTADPILPYRGGGLNATQIAATYHYGRHPPAGLPAPLGIDESMRRWAAHNRCDPAPTDVRIAPHVVRRTWARCTAATVLYVIDGGGHSWPGKPQPSFDRVFGRGTREIDATSAMFAFFFDGRVG